MNGNAPIVESVAQDKEGTGYVGVGYVIDSGTGKVRNSKGLDITIL